MTGNKRRYSGIGHAAAADALDEVLSPLTTRNPAARPQEPGTKADGYYRDLYTIEPDFKQLGRYDPAFQTLLKSGRLDFNDPNAVMQLTKALLRVDFGLQIDLPDDRLCPPVPNRHNYILWLKSLMDSTSYDDPGRKISGLDIGTGASCIYPLLGCTQRQWFFVGTDIDSKSLSYAKRNVQQNQLQNRIKIMATQVTSPLIPLDDLGADSIDFVMTNPPFYMSEDELLDSAKIKSRPPFTACTGATVEMVTEGGEVGFVGRIVEESLALQERVQWYTSMLGKQSSLELLVDILRKKGVSNYAVTEFIQGNKTRRWAIGWSFGSMRPSEDAARGMKAAIWKKILPPSVEIEVLVLPLDVGVGKLGHKLNEILLLLELVSWEWDREHLRGIGRARENVWSRAWRRKKAREGQTESTGEETEESDDSESCSFSFAVSVRVQRDAVSVWCRWLEGLDGSLFESFCGFLKTQLKEI